MDEIRIVNGTIQNPYREFSFTIAAGASVPVNYDHTCFRILSLTSGASLAIQFGETGGKTSVVASGMGFEYADGEGKPIALRSVRLFNDGASPITVTVGMAVGRVTDSRFSTSGTLVTLEIKAATLTPTSDVTFTAATVIKAVNATRRSIIITNTSSTTACRIGDSSVTTTKGHYLAPLASVVLDTTAAVYGVAASSVTVSVLEVID